MENIGVILPYKKEKSFVPWFVARFGFKVVPVEVYDLNFIVVNDKQNYSRIFKKHKVKNVVLMTKADVECCDYNIIDGKIVYKRMLPEFVRKAIKTKGAECRVAIVDKYMSKDSCVLAEQFCNFCRTVIMVSDNFKEAEKLSETLMEKYGAITEICDGKSIVNCDIAVIVDECQNKYPDDCMIIGKTKADAGFVVDDFKIPFKIKPPFGMSNIVFAQCVDKFESKKVDIS